MVTIELFHNLNLEISRVAKNCTKRFLIFDMRKSGSEQREGILFMIKRRLILRQRNLLLSAIERDEKQQ